MIALHPQYVVDENSSNQAVIIKYNEWESILEKLEELDDIEAYDLAKKENSEIISLDKAIEEIKKGKV